MKTIAIALSAVAVFASAAVSAQETSQLTRAQVVAEYQAARAAGQLDASGEAYQGNTVFVSTKTRADVKAELKLAQQRGEVTSGEQYPADFASPSGKTRAQVRAELAAARKAPADVNADLYAN
jgi:hypothetical protein